MIQSDNNYSIFPKKVGNIKGNTSFGNEAPFVVALSVNTDNQNTKFTLRELKLEFRKRLFGRKLLLARKNLHKVAQKNSQTHIIFAASSKKFATKTNLITFR